MISPGGAIDLRPFRILHYFTGNLYRSLYRMKNAESSPLKKILLVGDMNVDMILQGYRSFPAPGRETLVNDFVMTLGSSTAITGAGLTRLGHTVAFAGLMGADDAGAFCLRRLAALGIDTSRTQVDPGHKTAVTVAISSPDDRSLVTFLGTIPFLTPAAIPDTYFAGFDHLHSSSYFLQTGMLPDGFADVFRRARQHGLTVSLDPACDPELEWKSGLRETLPYVDVFLPNETELRGVTGEADPVAGLRALAGTCGLAVVKLGASGAMALQDGQPVRVRAPAVTPLDPTGAGDNFNSGFLHAWLEGRALAEALRLGVACGSFAVRAMGGTGAQATEQEALELLSAHKEQEQA
ncbi:MAG TPA: carbohydrate kinase family protein [Bryobacteraceae bacterium]|nr:carbohydrate kinase family protein [Bryobacteraceae bacterium]